MATTVPSIINRTRIRKFPGDCSPPPLLSQPPRSFSLLQARGKLVSPSKRVTIARARAISAPTCTLEIFHRNIDGKQTDPVARAGRLFQLADKRSRTCRESFVRHRDIVDSTKRAAQPYAPRALDRSRPNRENCIAAAADESEISNFTPLHLPATYDFSTLNTSRGSMPVNKIRRGLSFVVDRQLIEGIINWELRRNGRKEIIANGERVDSKLQPFFSRNFSSWKMRV